MRLRLYDCRNSRLPGLVGLWRMLPHPPGSYLPNVPWGDLVNQSKMPRTSIRSPDFQNLLLGKFLVVKVLPSFLNHVVAIVKHCSKKQMVRVAASGVVAFMKDLGSWGHGDKTKYPSHPWGNQGFPAEIKSSIPLLAFARDPRPARIHCSHLDLFPKPLSDWFTVFSISDCLHHAVVFFWASLAGPSSRSSGHYVLLRFHTV